MKRNKLKDGLLAIDPATHCGWAVDRSVYGVWDLTTRRDQSQGFKLLRFRALLEEACKLNKVEVIGYEKPGGRNYAALVLHSKLVGEIEKYCEENGIEYKGYSATDVKKFATGKGNSGKPAMIQAAKDKLGYTGDDDNEADALWILELLKHELKL
jgi:Holliday junction resolvasome RuvABC endonuclease subunit